MMNTMMRLSKRIRKSRFIWKGEASYDMKRLFSGMNDEKTEDDTAAEWELRTDKKTGKTFYLHPDTKQTTWHHPTVGLKPATFGRRFAAGAIDIVASMCCGTALGALLVWELDGMWYGQMGVAFGFLSSFTFRDSIIEKGSRSIGKKIMSLEIVTRQDGMVPTRVRTLGRNMYFPIFEAHSLLFPFVQLLFLSDLILVAYDRQRRRYGDFIAGTSVVPEMPMIKERLEESLEQRRLAQLKEELGDEWIWKIGKLQVAQDSTLEKKVESTVGYFQPPSFYSFSNPWQKKEELGENVSEKH